MMIAFEATADTQGIPHGAIVETLLDYLANELEGTHPLHVYIGGLDFDLDVELGCFQVLDDDAARAAGFYVDDDPDTL